MKKVQKQGGRSKITRKVLTFALITGLTLLPGCKTSNNIPNQFKNKHPMSDNMEKQKERKIDLKSVPKKEKKGEKKEEPEKIKQEEKKQEAIGIGGLCEPEPFKLKKVKRIH